MTRCSSKDLDEARKDVRRLRKMLEAALNELIRKQKIINKLKKEGKQS